MEYPRVNLILKSERRHQGAVSRKFLLISLLLTPVLLVAIFSGVKLIQYRSISKDLAANTVLWNDLKPRLELFKKEEKGFNENEAFLALIDGWNKSNVDMVLLLEDMRLKVPENVQVTRFSVQSEVGRSFFTEPSQLSLDFNMVLRGLSHGSKAEETVIHLQKNLMETDTLAKIFESIKLASMRKRKSVDGVNIREFNFEGSRE